MSEMGRVVQFRWPEGLVAEVDARCDPVRGVSRSSWVREAVLQRLARDRHWESGGVVSEAEFRERIGALTEPEIERAAGLLSLTEPDDPDDEADRAEFLQAHGVRVHRDPEPSTPTADGPPAKKSGRIEGRRTEGKGVKEVRDEAPRRPQTAHRIVVEPRFKKGR